MQSKQDTELSVTKKLLRKYALEKLLQRSARARQKTKPETMRSFTDMLLLVWKYPSSQRHFYMLKRPLLKLRYIARFVRACVILAKGRVKRKMSVHEKSLMSFMQTQGKHKNLMFDLDYFRANRELGLHPDIKRILLMPPQKKTYADLVKTQSALRAISAFAEFPTPMQLEFCKHGWYQKIEPNKVILKEGHKALNFYIILSGTVVITAWDETTKTSQTKCMLQQGTCFGDIALIDNSYRTATVLSHTETELLCIDAQDYLSIYICGTLQPIQDPTVYQFLESLEMLRNFPLHKFKSKSGILLYHHFQRGTALVKDSKHSEWIYIVKSGSLSIMKKLRKPEVKSDSSISELIQRCRHLSQLTPRKMKEQTHNRVKQITTAFKTAPQHKDAANVSTLRLSRSHFLPPISELKEGVDKHIGVVSLSATEAIHTQGPYLVRSSTKSQSAEAMYKMKLPPLVEAKESLASRLDSSSDYASSGADDADSVFISICVLEKGQHFGIHNSIFDDQPSLSLISNGADCLLVSKKFFFGNCSDEVLRCLAERESPYPADIELQKNLYDYEAWILYKKRLYHQMVAAV